MTQALQDRIRPRPSSESAPTGTTKVEITLSIKPELMAILQGMASESHQTLDAVFTTALALYRASLNALAEGKHIGYTSSPDDLEVEFIGFVELGEK